MGKTEPSFTPGEILNEELEARGWDTAKFAATLGRTFEETTRSSRIGWRSPSILLMISGKHSEVDPSCG